MSPPKKPRKPSDYMWFAGESVTAGKPILLADKKAQSDLIRRAVFGMKQ
jgi:hypothetical protein